MNDFYRGQIVRIKKPGWDGYEVYRIREIGYEVMELDLVDSIEFHKYRSMTASSPTCSVYRAGWRSIEPCCLTLNHLKE